MFGWFDGFVRGFVLIIDTFFDGVFLTFFILFTNVSLYVLIFLYSFTVGLLYFTEKLIEVEFTENRTDFDSISTFTNVGRKFRGKGNMSGGILF